MRGSDIHECGLCDLVGVDCMRRPFARMGIEMLISRSIARLERPFSWALGIGYIRFGEW